ncbi:MAG: MBL fold metallo-hydrolase [Acidimicrobiales bacterium]
MTTTVTITGTGCPIPTPDRAGPGVLVTYGDIHLQFDAGRATVNRLMAANSSPNRLTAVFLTHHHSDHTMGLQDVVITRWIMERNQPHAPLTIVAPAGPAVTFAERMLDVWSDDLAVRQHHTGRTTAPTLDLRSFPNPDGIVEVWRSDGAGEGSGTSEGVVTVKAGQVRHEPVLPAVGFRVETPDGIIAITGDTLVCDEVAELCAGADIVVYEALRFSQIDPKAPNGFIRDYHADTAAIGTQLADMDIPTLVLTHLIPPPRNEAEEQGFREDVVNGGYGGDVIVARDLTSVTLG